MHGIFKRPENTTEFQKRVKKHPKNFWISLRKSTLNCILPAEVRELHTIFKRADRKQDQMITMEDFLTIMQDRPPQPPGGESAVEGGRNVCTAP